jgi:hypothetical protein
MDDAKVNRVLERLDADRIACEATIKRPGAGANSFSEFS